MQTTEILHLVVMACLIVNVLAAVFLEFEPPGKRILGLLVALAVFGVAWFYPSKWLLGIAIAILVFALFATAFSAMESFSGTPVSFGPPPVQMLLLLGAAGSGLYFVFTDGGLILCISYSLLILVTLMQVVFRCGRCGMLFPATSGQTHDMSIGHVVCKKCYYASSPSVSEYEMERGKEVAREYRLKHKRWWQFWIR